MNLQEKQRWQRKFLAVLDGFRLLDDKFMTVVFQNSIACVELVLRIILDSPSLSVSKVITQDTLKNLHGRGLCLDIHAFAEGREYNIEIQRAQAGAGARRARYHSSLMDAGGLLPGEDYTALPESYVIFITETDVLGYGDPIYMIRRTIQGRQKVFDDGSHIVYVNSMITDQDTPLGKLMHDFRCARPEDMYHEVLAERIRYFKQTEEGVATVSKTMEDALKEFIEEEKEQWIQEGMESGMERGIERGRENERIFSIRTLMHNLGFTAEKAMDALSVPLSERGRYLSIL